MSAAQHRRSLEGSNNNSRVQLRVVAPLEGNYNSFRVQRNVVVL